MACRHNARCNPSVSASSVSQVGAIRRRILHPATLISLGIAVLLLIAFARGVDVSFADMARAIGDANPLLIAAAFIAYYVNFPLRGIRWRLLIQNAQAGTVEPVPLLSRRAFSEVILLGWFVNAVAWLRMGDPYRAYLVSRQHENQSYPRILGTVLAERVLDVVTFAAILLPIGALLWVDASGATTAIIGLTVIIGGGGIFLVVGMALFGRRVTARLPGSVRDWLEGLRVGALLSLSGRLWPVTILSISGWAAEGVRLALVSWALGLDIPLPVIAFVALAHNLITAIPSTPGGLGVAEAGMVGLLLPWVALEDAAVLTALDRSVTWLSVIVIGGIGFGWREGVRRGRF